MFSRKQIAPVWTSGLVCHCSPAVWGRGVFTKGSVLYHDHPWRYLGKDKAQHKLQPLLVSLLGSYCLRVETSRIPYPPRGEEGCSKDSGSKQNLQGWGNLWHWRGFTRPLLKGKHLLQRWRCSVMKPPSCMQSLLKQLGMDTDIASTEPLP